MSISAMTPEELAAKLDGREIGEEITPEESEEARAAGLLVLYGASDDLLEAEGAFRDEVGAFGCDDYLIDAEGFIPWARPEGTDEEVEHYFARKKLATVKVRAEWCPRDVDGDPSWVISTPAPCATFRIMEDGQLFCVGIVLVLPGGAA